MAGKAFRRYKELHLGQLRAFCACVRQKSFSAAARALRLSQPAVWQQVRALERDFGVALLRRRGREWEPSEDGRVLAELASSIVGSVDSLKEVFEQRRQDVPRTITVIGSASVITEVLARPVVEFCRQYPTIKVALLHYTGLETLDLLIDGDADVAILPLTVDLSGNRSFLAPEPFAECPWVLIMPAGHPLAGKRRLTLADVVRHPLILPSLGSEGRKSIDEAFRAADLLDRMQVRVELGLSVAARGYVQLGLGVGLFPNPGVGVELPGIRERPLGSLIPAK
jgi:DNA-binding transcriptional LysR family regulator